MGMFLCFSLEWREQEWQRLLAAQQWRALWKRSQTSSSLLSVMSHVNERWRDEGTKSRKQIGEERQVKTRVRLQNATNAFQGRGSCAHPCFHSDPNVISVQWRQSGALRCGRAVMSHTCQCPADRTEHTAVSIHSTCVTPAWDTGSPVAWAKEARHPVMTQNCMDALDGGRRMHGQTERLTQLAGVMSLSLWSLATLTKWHLAPQSQIPTFLRFLIIRSCTRFVYTT